MVYSECVPKSTKYTASQSYKLPSPQLNPTLPTGSFEGITHIARLLDLTRSGAMRDTMLLLIEQLLTPAAAATQVPAQRAARANGQVRASFPVVCTDYKN